MKINGNNKNRDYFLNQCKDIIKTDSGYSLQNVYKEDDDGNLIKTSERKNNPNNNHYYKNCYRCTYSNDENCLLRTELENCPKNRYIPFCLVENCDAYSPIYPLNIIKSENEMIDFIEKMENFFDCPESYDSYFGFERKWDEETGEILETVREYYDRGGGFTNIPDKFPCVIYFGIVDFEGERRWNDKLDWIYIGEGE